MCWFHSRKTTLDSNRLVSNERMFWSEGVAADLEGNSLQCSCLENPRDGGAWWAAVYGVAQSRTRLKQLSSSSSSSRGSALFYFLHVAIQRGTWQIAKSWTRLSNWACVHVQLSQHCFFLPLSKISWPWMYGFHFWTQFYSIYLYIYSYTNITLFWLVLFCCKFWNWDVLVLQLEKEMATHSSILAWRIPGTGEPSGLPSMESHRVGHWRLSSSSSSNWLLPCL